MFKTIKTVVKSSGPVNFNKEEALTKLDKATKQTNNAYTKYYAKYYTVDE